MRSEPTGPTDEQRRLLESAKQGGLSVPIRDAAGLAIASLQPITAAMAGEPALLGDLCRWRSAARYGFLTVFEPTVQTTARYLTGLSLPDPSRILFLVIEEGRRVGNIGLCSISAREAELDNVLRGERPRTPGLMKCAERALSAWAVERLGVERVFLRVLSDNAPAIASYERAGFRVTGSEALRRVVTPDGYQLVPSPEASSPDLPTLVRMEIGALSLQRPGSAVLST